jgi:hypothetical protein
VLRETDVDFWNDGRGKVQLSTQVPVPIAWLTGDSVDV